MGSWNQKGIFQIMPSIVHLPRYDSFPLVFKRKDFNGSINWWSDEFGRKGTPSSASYVITMRRVTSNLKIGIKNEDQDLQNISQPSLVLKGQKIFVPPDGLWSCTCLTRPFFPTRRFPIEYWNLNIQLNIFKFTYFVPFFHFENSDIVAGDGKVCPGRIKRQVSHTERVGKRQRLEYLQLSQVPQFH